MYDRSLTEPAVPDKTIPGATADWSISSADFDLDHGVSANSELLYRLAAEAHEGEDYPAEAPKPGGGPRGGSSVAQSVASRF